jgi:CheY-like chemotaxis protein
LQTAEEDDLDMDIELDEDAAEEAFPGVLIFEMGGSNLVQFGLEQIGVKSRTVKSGPEAMAAASQGELRAVVVAEAPDDELRALFARAFKSRFPTIPMIYVTSEAQNPQAVQQMRGEGAEEIINWPLPPPSELLPKLRAFIPINQPPPTIIPEVGEQSLQQEQKTIAMQLAKNPQLLAPLNPPGLANQSNQAFEQAVVELAVKKKEVTGLRSELSIVRDRGSILEDRIRRLAADLEVVTKERDSLAASAATADEQATMLVDPAAFGGGGASPNTPASGTGAYVDVKRIALGTDNYSWGLEQLVEFLEELQIQVGPNGPSLKPHVDLLKQVLQLHRQIRKAASSL